ncbi:MAG: hypothetical protein CVU90_04985 [Firmicutes bacterium HGW-Firmicutes-15]|nr:MAG: hypothetical protein CVU90_04985 [Firmicutes bacterium HGW-Firmicutes-15]
MSFLQKYLFNKRLKQLEELLEAYKKERNEDCQTKKTTKTKNGAPIYLVHCPSLEEGQLFGGFIYLLTTKGFDGCLSYTVLRDKEQWIHIDDIHHKILNQGIGTQLLMYIDEISRESNIKRIIAWLSPIDLGSHKERLLHFYMKNGYQIAEGKDPVWTNQGLIATKYL